MHCVKTCAISKSDLSNFLHTYFRELYGKIARVTRAARRRMVELREETGVQRSLTERLVRSRLQWAGHVERMADDRLPKWAAELREQGRRRQGRPRLRWEDCVKRDVRKAGEEEDWKKKTQDRVGWKRLADEAVKKLQASPHPWQREKEEEGERYGKMSCGHRFKTTQLPFETWAILFIRLCLPVDQCLYTMHYYVLTLLFSWTL